MARASAIPLEPAGRAGRLLSPIFHKEIRSMFRRKRFFLAHQISLALFATAILTGIMAKQNSQTEAVEVGQWLFVIFFVFQAAVVTFVIPSFSCTAILTEREEKSFDLLVTTMLEPWEIVWGKFTASVIYTIVFLLSTVPLVGISFLFGGIEASLLLLAYLLLLLYGGLLSIVSLYFSSLCRRATSAVGLTYGTILPAAAAGIYALSFTAYLKDPAKLVSDTGKALASGSPLESAAPWLFFTAAAFFFFFLCATNRIRPTFGNKASSLRVFAAAFLLGGAFVLWTARIPFFTHAALAKPDPALAAFQETLARMIRLVFWASATFTVFFSTEGASVPARIRREIEGLTGWRAVLRPFYPGGRRGVRFVLILYAATVSLLVLVPAAVENSSAWGLVARNWDGYLLLAALPGFALFCLAALGILLSAWCRTPRLPRTFLFVLAVMGEAAPILLRGSGILGGDAAGRPDLWTFSWLSPSAALESVRLWGFGAAPAALAWPQDYRAIFIGGSVFPEFFVSAVFYGGLGLLALLAGAPLRRRSAP